MLLLHRARQQPDGGRSPAAAGGESRRCLLCPGAAGAACGLPAPHSPKSQQRTGSRRRCARRPFGGFSPLLPLSGHSHFPPQGRGEAKRKAPPGPAPINRGAPLVFQGSPKTIRKEKENYFLGIKPFWFTQYLGSLPSSITWQISRTQFMPERRRLPLEKAMAWGVLMKLSSSSSFLPSGNSS